MSSSVFFAAARACVSDALRVFATGANAARLLSNFSRSAETCFSISSPSILKVPRWNSYNLDGSKKNAPVLFECELQFQAFHFHFAFPFMLQDGLVWLSMFWGGSVPCALAILVGLELAQDGKVAHDIAICSACTRVRMTTAELEMTYLPRGVVRPIPLYMVAMTKGR